jgi:hypothetical protein
VGGTSSITEHGVEHWAGLIAHGALVPAVADPARHSLRQQALAYLISVHWLLGEASQDGLKIAPQELTRLVRREEGASGSGAELKARLSESGETEADVRLEASARWAAAALARRLASTADRSAAETVTGSVVESFYRAHIERYRLRERRRYDLIEGIPSKATAQALAKRLGSGKRFAEAASKELPFRPARFDAPRGQGAVYRVVFKARRGVLVGPLPLQGAWALFVLRRIEPARVQPLSEVQNAIKRQLNDRVRSQLVKGLIRAYRSKWTVQTDCRTGYVVQKCRQYVGSMAPEREPFTSY